MGATPKSFKDIQELSEFLDLIHKTIEGFEGKGFVVYDVLDDSYMEDGGEIYFNKDQLDKFLSDLGEDLRNVVVYGLSDTGIDCTKPLLHGDDVVEALDLVLENLENLINTKTRVATSTRSTGPR